MIYSLLGWMCESVFVSVGQKRWINSGFLYGPFCPIYGFGAIFVLLFLSPLIQYPLLVFLFGIFLTSVLEYFTSWLLESLFHVLWWDYSHHKYNINGRVCLLNSFLFGCMSLFVLYILHPFVSQLVESIPPYVLQIISWILFVYLICDLFFSVKSLISFKQQLIQFEQRLAEIKTALSKEIPSFNLDVKEKVETFFENHHELESFRQQLQNSYENLKENRKHLHYRKKFPHLKLSNKHHLQGLSEYIKNASHK